MRFHPPSPSAHKRASMNRSLQILFALLACFNLATHARAAVMIDDTFADADRKNWNLPNDSPWYSWTSGTNAFIGIETNNLFCTNLVGVTRYFWTYFTSNAPELTIPFTDGVTGTNLVSN